MALSPLTIVLLILYSLLILTGALTLIAGMHKPTQVEGQAGKQGTNGDPGGPGIQGLQGPTGALGPFYLIAVEGYGYIGNTGPTGVLDNSGQTGPRGVTGPTGPSTGATGPPGARGPTPIAGITGPTGGANIRGKTGPTGPLTPGPVSVSLLYKISYPVGATGTSTISVGYPVEILPNPYPSEFTIGTGTIQFNTAPASYIVRIGIDYDVLNLPSNWDPCTLILQQFPAPPGMPQMDMWPALISPTTAVGALGATIVYNNTVTGTIFTPLLEFSISGVTGTTQLNVPLLSVTIEHVAP